MSDSLIKELLFLQTLYVLKHMEEVPAWKLFEDSENTGSFSACTFVFACVKQTIAIDTSFSSKNSFCNSIFFISFQLSEDSKTLMKKKIQQRDI